MSSYVLENVAEFERLEKQSKMENYLLNYELKNLSLVNGQKVLDAGCGSGLVSRFLQDKFSHAVIDACDFSEVRLQQAKKFARENGFNNIHFFQTDLHSLKDVPNEHYDCLVNRFVLEHVKDPSVVCQEFFRVLKKDAQVCVVDLDGILFNIHTNNEEFNRLNQELQDGWDTDLFMGRKIPSLLKQVGFRNIRWDIQLMKFNKEDYYEDTEEKFEKVNDLYPKLFNIFDDENLTKQYAQLLMRDRRLDLIDEIELTIERLEFITPKLQDLFQSDEKVYKYRAYYLQEMIKSETTLFYTKFIVHALK